MSITRHHNDWLRLVPNSGPFLSLPVLSQVFPQGLDAHDAEHARRLRLAFDEWDDNQLSHRADAGFHRLWVRFVLGETLCYDELLADGQAIPQSVKSDVAEYGETLRPDWIVSDPATKKVRLLVQVYPRSQSLTKPVATSRWKTSPDTRMMQLLHDTGIRLGIVTNGDHWMVVNAPKNETTGYASWYANLWLEEPITLRAFRTVLGADRLFSVPDDQTLEALLDKSASDQQEVTDQLGYQVRKAVEVLIQALDKADQDHGRKLLADVDEKVLYESALTVMMRLVFLFCAEERELLLLGDELYDKNYAVSTLREQLRVTADQFGEEILGLRYDAWTRLLTTFRAVYGGVKHDRLKLPAYGGSLFNPDRFPFLEGRKSGTSWNTTEATPLPVSNRTVLHLLEALQVLQTKVGRTIEARNLSFQSLGIEQIGGVYEVLLDHTAKRATEPILGLAGTRDKEPEIALAKLEKIAAKGEKELLKFLKDETGRSESALKKALSAGLDDQHTSQFRTVCQNADLWHRVKPFAGLVRLDDVNYPVVITTGSVFATTGTDRRSSGTHYTPPELTIPIVQYTLEPLVYIGPAEGLPKEDWKLRSAKELLDLKICDMACGSGAFLVQACRYMAARLLEAWDAVQRADPATLRITPEGQPSTGTPDERLIPDDPDERQTYALRIVAQRCIYGVDKNPLAAEMAKLSLWLLTLAKDKPFEFLDHAIRCGDSLVGIHNTAQLRKFDLRAGTGVELETASVVLQYMDAKINDATSLRRQITQMQANTVEDVEAQDRMLREANDRIDRLQCAADLLISAEFVPGSAADKRAARDNAAIKVAVHFHDNDLVTFRREASKALNGNVTFHWPIEFPEVMVDRGGFDAFVGNPPFMGGRKISSNFGDEYERFLKRNIVAGTKGTLDLVLYFLIRGAANLRPIGVSGFIATDSIRESDSRDVGMPLLFSTVTPYRTVPSRPWPGVAGVRISLLHFSKKEWAGEKWVGETVVDDISPMLDGSTQLVEPTPLSANAGFCSDGVKVQGIGFVVDEQEAESLIVADPRNRKVVTRYIVGDDINSNPQHLSDRWVINFWNRPEEECKQYGGPWQILVERVKPYRDGLTKQVHEDCFWKFWDRREEFFNRVRRKNTVLVCSKLSKYVGICKGDPSNIFSEKAKVFDFSTDTAFAVLQSSFHIVWALTWGSSTGETPAYVGSRCFDTFPFPHFFYVVGQCMRLDSDVENSTLQEIGGSYYSHRKGVLCARNEGLTKTYNHFHDADETSADIQKLRELHVEMDRAVAAAYGWTDLNLGHAFHETKQGVRFTISEPARLEVLARLLKLNHERYAEEVALGLHDQKTKRRTTSKRKATATKLKTAVEPTLFDPEEAFPTKKRDKVLCGLLCDLIAAQPGLPATAYLDMLVIALRHERLNRLLIGDDQTRFTTLAKEAFKGIDQSAGPVSSAEVVRVLSLQNTITQKGSTLAVGADFDERRELHPACDPILIALLHKAGATLREFQGVEESDLPEEAEIVREHKLFRREDFGVAT